MIALTRSVLCLAMASMVARGVDEPMSLIFPASNPASNPSSLENSLQPQSKYFEACSTSLSPRPERLAMMIELAGRLGAILEM
jgi:hypothetical protein